MVTPKKMNIFGDDESELEDVDNSQMANDDSDNSDPTVFYQDVQKSVNSKQNITDEEDDHLEHYDDNHYRKKERQRKLKRYKEMQNSYYNTPLSQRANAFRNYNRYDSYRSPAPSFSKEDNGRFVNQIIMAILIVLALIFIFRSDSAYVGVTAVILIIVIIGNITKKKGSNRK